MKLNTGYTKIATDETLRETIQHGTEEYPFHFYYEDISMFDFHCIDWHWHPEFELVYVERGALTFSVGEKQLEVSEGKAIFINSRVIHRFDSEEEAVIPNIVFSPSFLSAEESFIYKKYVLPVIDSSLNYLIFSQDVSWQQEIINIMLSVFLVQKDDRMKELATKELLLKLWSCIFEHVCSDEAGARSGNSSRIQARLQLMMQYIHDNYAHQITLEDIAETAMISKSSTLNIFRKNLHITPVNYLINYRLKQASRLLVKTENSVFAISQDVGFENVGYFCRKFKAAFGITPTEYRKGKT